ncbi:nuclear transport factor 2 family protein, partial [Rhizobium ruizarguesonis]
MNHAASASVEEEIIALSLEKFRWKTSGRIDLVEALFDDDLHFVHITGHVSSKREWIEELRSGRFVYNRIDPRGASVAVEGDRATLRGKAVFT